ncbi:MAG: PQQ-binding-like beta-propeller repeat protein [Nitrospinae bacterium]|nr:PQQ-binding-like beta-propeller repeat protein [Nitrospinota bacterium]
MKKLTVLFALIAFTASALWPSTAGANSRTFPSGSYIIPMNSTYQPSADKGIFMAYGLVFQILKAGGTVYWIIDESKTTISAPDITISSTTVSPVVSLYNHAGGTSAVSGVGSTVSYSGAPFVITTQDGLTQSQIETIINDAGWTPVDVHKANIAFTANVSRELKGTPPKLALLNSVEDLTTGNAQILESYLRLAGICTDVYTIVSPNNVRDGALASGGYTILWAPHWTGYSSYSTDGNGNGITDVEDIVTNVASFLDAGNSLFAECASIEVFEHSQNGHFLTNYGIDHDGGTNDSAKIIYHDTTAPFSQVGDYTYAPEGGHLHNWRPFTQNAPPSPAETYDSNFTPVPSQPAQYNSTVSRFTYDDADGNLTTTTDQWDYYTGGRKNGDDTKGYVVYLGGHKYATCSSGGSTALTTGVHNWDFEQKSNIGSEVYTFVVTYTGGSASCTAGSPCTVTASNVSKAAHDVTVGTILQLNFASATISGDKKISGVVVTNLGTSAISISSIRASWTGGSSSQKTKKLSDTTDGSTLYSSEESSGHTYSISSSYSIESPSTGSGVSCVNNSDCSFTNVAGVRYVLNTLFNLQYTVVDVDYMRSSPVVMDNTLYQGSFAYPSYRGHMKAYDATSASSTPLADLADSVPASSSRTLYTSVDGANMIPFTTAQLGTNTSFQTALSMSVPYAGNTAAYDKVVNRIRGKTSTGADMANRLGAVEHSAAAIVKPYNRSNATRPVTAYFGTLDGVLEAFNVNSLHGGAGAVTELWGYVPKSQLGALKDDRTITNPVQPFPGADASPTVSEAYYDHDNNPGTDKQWRTILTTLHGKYGASRSIIAMDITDPTSPSLKWETVGTNPSTGLEVMGNGYKTAIGPVLDAGGSVQAMVFAATTKVVNTSAIPAEMGGVQVFAFDLKTGATLWRFSVDYSGTQNELPGAIVLLDKTRDGYIDEVIVGDMDGRLWELDALTGSNVNGAGIPLFNGGSGATVSNAGVNYPISAPPTIAVDENFHFIVIFGTGGADFAPADASYIHSIIAIDITDKLATPSTLNGAGTFLWQQNLAVGEKVWGSPTVANGIVYVNTMFGTGESANPRDDINSTTSVGKLHAIDMKTGAATFTLDTANSRGSVYIKKGHAYVSSRDGQVIQVGNEDFSSGTPVNVHVLSWEEK